MTLIELSIGLVILGIMIGAGMQMYAQQQSRVSRRVTDEHMRIIVKALNEYVEVANRLPCPADPAANDVRFGFEAGAPAATVTSGRMLGLCKNGDAGKPYGLVPYQVLNIPYDTIKDGWGRYITYAVSPVFTQQSDGYPTDNQQVHPMCRDGSWVNAGNDPSNAPKARFCCAMKSSATPPSSDLKIRSIDAAGAVISPERTEAGYGSMDSMLTQSGTYPAAAPRPTAAADVEAGAFVLVSHGPNGSCAFLGDDTLNYFNCGSDVSAEERQNSAGNDYYSGGPTGSFDDIVVWNTQFGIMAAGGANSCSLP